MIEGQEENPVMLAIPAAPIEQMKYELMRKFDIDMLENSANAVGIYSEDDARGVVSMALQARKIEKALDQSRAEIVKPHFSYQRDINKMVKLFTEKLDKIQLSLKSKLDDWIKKENDNPFARVDEIEVEDGKYYIKKKWCFDVEDSSKIPFEFMQPNLEAIEESINKGMRNIPGVKVYEIEETHLRVKN
jgi:hypothetical protein